METLQFSRGDVIFMENSIGSSMYEIKSGSVGIYAAYGTDSERKLTELEAGSIFGEMGVIDVMPRSATAIAMSDTEVEEITTADIQSYFDEKPERLLAIMRGLSRRLRELTADYQQACGAMEDWSETAKTKTVQKDSALMRMLKRFAALYTSAAATDSYQCYDAFSAD